MKKFIVLPLMAMAAISSAQVAWVSGLHPKNWTI